MNLTTTILSDSSAGRMSGGEMRFCKSLQTGIDASLAGSVDFIGFFSQLWKDLHGLREFHFDVDAALAAGFKPSLESVDLASAQTTHPHHSLTEEESEFLKDMEGFISFATRNGLVFDSVLSVIAHDVREIVRDGSLQKALEEHFSPKVQGWARRNREPVGDADEQ